MAWDSIKSTFKTLAGVAADEKLTATEWNDHVTDQQNRGFNTLTTATSNYSPAYQEVVLADASGGDMTITLPTPAESGMVLIKRIDSSNNTVTIATPGSQTIDGDNTRTLDTQYISRKITSDGTDYYIV